MFVANLSLHPSLLRPCTQHLQRFLTSSLLLSFDVIPDDTLVTKVIVLLFEHLLRILYIIRPVLIHTLVRSASISMDASYNMEMDDLFGDSEHVALQAITALPPVKGLARRVDELGVNGCCQ